ncbi:MULTISPECIES: RNA 2',3'-cyclic phosphodiesterase [unclassified Paenibacillus]|uniref:RNA 2',3'-cyclic phosphodiesterase n=1 Tax=unclassified Paenibacillus TaxID=185978 RepID=UPI003633B8F1
MNKDRLFLALPLGEEQSSFLQQLMETLQPTLSFQKWVHKDDLHITLKFLGDTPTAALSGIQSHMKKVAASVSTFQLSLDSLGTFGKPFAPSVLWIRVGGHLTALNALHAQTEAAMESVDFPMEGRPYSPHITIARKYSGEAAFTKAALASANNELKSSPMQWTANRIVLYRSYLGRRPMYEAIDTYSLSQEGVRIGSLL